MGLGVFLNAFSVTVLSNNRFRHVFLQTVVTDRIFLYFRSLVDTVYALKDEVQELRQVGNLLHL